MEEDPRIQIEMAVAVPHESLYSEDKVPSRPDTQRTLESSEN
jgi:hypothetical protein